ncbi:MAG TPA: CGNR zinc finger domain-containing protein [Chloroflexota bacterium]|nr:CGNR zinc finger domain-containing protein [Chloroflexota bacterium]
MEDAFSLEGGWLCLGFCNTVGWHSGAYRRAELYRQLSTGAARAEGVSGSGWGEEHNWEFCPEVPGSHERFADYRALMSWFLRKRQIGLGEAKRLLRAARAQPEAAELVRRRAISLRETLYHLFSALSHGDAPDPRDVAALNDWLPEALSRRRLVYAERSDGEAAFTWEPAAPPDELGRVLWPVVWSAMELLTSGPLDRVRECDNDPCGWLFVDLSRNRSRRWCDMRDCGNRVKARRPYQRVRAASA